MPLTTWLKPNHRGKRQLSRGSFGAIMAAPGIFAVVIMIAFPIAWTVYNSLFLVDRFTPDKPPIFVGLQNYAAVLSKRYVLISLRNTAFFVVLSVSIEFVLGMIAALVLFQPLPGRRVIRTLLLTPVMIAPVVAGLQWRWLLVDQYGVINLFLKLLHLPTPLWLANPRVAMWSVVIVDIWMTFPFVMLVLAAGLTSIPNEIIECSIVDGATYWQRLRWIIIPSMRSTIVVVLLMRTMNAFKVFDTIYVLTRGGPAMATESISTYTYRMVFDYLDFESGSALAVMVTGLLALLAILMTRILESEDLA